MTKFIPYEKLSKKKKRELDSKRRKNLGQDNSGYPETDEPQSVQQTEGTEVES